MKREDGMEAGRVGGVQERLALRRLTKREIDRRIASIAAEVEGAEPERVEYLGQAVYPRPMDTKKFVRLMARHMSLN
jgi:hypothetical protein